MKRRGHTLIGTMVALVVLALLAVVLLKGGLGGSYSQNAGASPRADGRGTTMPGLVKATAEDSVCRTNLSHARQAVQVARLGNGDVLPATLEETRLQESMLRCPLGKTPYRYDPATGAVTCAHPGHEGY